MATAKEVLISSSSLQPPAKAKDMFLNLKQGDFNQNDRENLEKVLKIIAPDKKTINVATGIVEFINNNNVDLKLQILEADELQIQNKIEE